MRRQPISVSVGSDLTNLESDICTFESSDFLEVVMTSTRKALDHLTNTAGDPSGRFNGDNREFDKRSNYAIRIKS